jgi:DNA-binding NtrC family response regulator
VLEALRLLLKPEGYAIETASSPQQLLRALEQKDFDVVLMDLNYARDTTSGRRARPAAAHPHGDESLPVVVMTAWGSVNVAVEAMRRGARDFIQKPWDNERLLAIIRTQTELGRALRRGRSSKPPTRRCRPMATRRSSPSRPAMRRCSR